LQLTSLLSGFIHLNDCKSRGKLVLEHGFKAYGGVEVLLYAKLLLLLCFVSFLVKKLLLMYGISTLCELGMVVIFVINL
jgi:hypothetical protein